MPVANVIDRRTNKYEVNCEVFFEPSCHDNYHVEKISKAGTVFKGNEGQDNPEYFVVDYEETAETTINDAIRYAAYKWPTLPVTMFLYDIGTNANVG